MFDWRKASKWVAVTVNLSESTCNETENTTDNTCYYGNKSQRHREASVSKVTTTESLLMQTELIIHEAQCKPALFKSLSQMAVMVKGLKGRI